MPLPTERLANTALQAIGVDKELSPLVRRHLTVVPASQNDAEDHARLLRAEYRATTNRMLRVAVNSFMESLKLVIEVMEQLDVDVLEQQQAENTKQPV